MKSFPLVFTGILLLSQTSFARTLNCIAEEYSPLNIEVQVTSDAFDNGKYTGKGKVTLRGLEEHDLNMTNAKATYIKLQNNSEYPVFSFHRGKKDYFQIVFNQTGGRTASVQYTDSNGETFRLAWIRCN